MKVRHFGIPVLLVLITFFTACEKDEKTDTPVDNSFSIDLGTDKIIKEGESVTLDASVDGASYLWSTGATTSTIVVDTTGNFWVEVTKGDVIHSDTVDVQLSYPTIKIETGFGNIRMWLYQQTPLHKANFLDLTNQHFYDGLIFHRVVENFVIQGGDPDGNGFGGPGYTIPAEIIPGLNHVYGAVGAARQPDNVNPDKESNGSQFYIVCDPNGEPSLNGNYTVFGIVFEGLTTVHDISMVPVDGNDKPIDDVIMNNVSTEYFTAPQLADDFGFIIP